MFRKIIVNICMLKKTMFRLMPDSPLRAVVLVATNLTVWAACAGIAAAGLPGQRLLPDNIRVDSTGDRYHLSVPHASDGYREAEYWRKAWASDDRRTAPRWLEFQFEAAVPVEAVAIHWALDDTHPKASGAPATSSNYRIQALQNGNYKDIVSVTNKIPETRTVHSFKRIKTDRVRIWQPAGGGPAGRTNVMWITEFEVYDYPKKETDFGTPADMEEVRRVRETVRQQTVGFYLRGIRATELMPLVREKGWRTIGLDHLNEKALARCRIVILSGWRHIPDRETLLAFLYNGGGALFLHNSCGRGAGSLLPDLWEFKGVGEGELHAVNTAHPVGANLPERFSPSYGEYMRLRAGRRGVVLVRDAANYDVVVAGSAGRGKAVAIGHFPGRSSGGTEWSELTDKTPEGAELILFNNSIAWLEQNTAPRDIGRKTRSLRKELRRLRKRYQPIFEDVTKDAGIVYSGYSKNVAMADINHNGRLDIFTTVNVTPSADPYHNLLFRNDGNWQFREISAEAGVTGPPGIGSVFGDVTGDGNLDLWVSWLPEMRGEGRGTLYLGDGRCGFRDVTDESGLGETGMTAACMMADINNNGHLDIYLVGFQSDNTLFINRGDGTFDERTEAFGLADLGSAGGRGYGALSAAMADLDHSGFVDLVLFSGGGLRIFRNENGERFTEVTDYMGPGKPLVEGSSLGIALGDINNNGRLDIYAAGINVLLRNDGNMRFTDITAEAGFGNLERHIHAYGPKFVDWNNSGYLDLFLATGWYDSFAFHNNGDGTFTDVTAGIGLDVFGIHGFNFGDLDGDGDLDFYATSWGKFPFLLLRNNTDDGNALTVRVRGTQSNTSGVGAKIWVYEEKPEGKLELSGYREVRAGGGSMYSGGILQQHIGLGAGAGEKTYTVEALFPVSGERVTVSNIAPHKIITIVEPDGK